MRLTSAFAAVLLIGGLTACDLIGPRVVSGITDNYDPGEYAREAKTRPIPVTVYGSAFGVGGDALTQAVIGDMTGQDWTPHARFTTAAAATQGGYFSVAVVLNGPAGVTGASLCGHPPAANASGAATSGDVRLIASLCRYDQAVTDVEVRTGGVSGLKDPKFAALIATAIRNLTPPIVVNRMNDTSDPTN